MIEWVVIGVGAALGAGILARAVRGKKSRGDWAERLEEVAARVGGRPSVGAEHPELRAEVDGTTVTLRLVDVAAGARGRVEAQASLPDPDNTARLYLGWDTSAPPAGLEHVPEVAPDGPSRLEGHLVLRADDPTLAHRALAAARLDLVDIRKEANARALELTARGGYLTLVVHGLEPTTSLLERSLKVVARLARVVDEASRGTALPAPEAHADGDPEEPAAGPTPVPPDARCELCDSGERAGIGWVRCGSCGAPYHEDCWAQATACLAVGCHGTRADPAPGAG